MHHFRGIDDFQIIHILIVHLFTPTVSCSNANHTISYIFIHSCAAYFWLNLPFFDDIAIQLLKHENHAYVTIIPHHTCGDYKIFKIKIVFNLIVYNTNKCLFFLSRHLCNQPSHPGIARHIIGIFERICKIIRVHVICSKHFNKQMIHEKQHLFCRCRL